MRRPNLARLNPWARKQNRRFEQYRETEKHEWMDAIERHRKDRDEKERQIDLALFQERREGSNWLENREMRMSAMVLEYQRTLIAVRIEIRKRLGMECPALLSDEQLSKLEQTMLQSLQVARQARRDDYERRARAAGVQAHRSEHRDAAEYGDLQALVRREVRQLALARSLGRTVKPAGTSLARRLWNDPVWSKVIAAALIALIAAIYGLIKHRGWWSALLP